MGERDTDEGGLPLRNCSSSKLFKEKFAVNLSDSYERHREITSSGVKNSPLFHKGYITFTSNSS